MKNAKDVENPLNLNVLSAIGSIMQCLCQLSWRKTMGQMVKMERKAATKPLILVCECKLPLFPGSAQAVPLEISRDEWDFCSMRGCSGSCAARCFTLCTADGSWEVQPRHWSLHTYTHKKINTYIVCVTRPWQSCSGSPSLGCIRVHVHFILACPWHITWAGLLYQHMDSHR